MEPKEAAEILKKRINDPEEEIVPVKRRRSKDNDVEGQSSIFDMLEENE